MTQHGGKRPGAGRKKGSLASHTLEAQEIRTYLIEEVIRDRGSIVRALINKAKGGDISAIREILERTLGRTIKEQYNINEDSLFQELKIIQSRQRKIIEMAREKNKK